MTTPLNTPLMEERIARKQAVNELALLRMELEEAATDRDRYKRERDLALRENERLTAENAALHEKPPVYHPRRRRAEVRYAVTWLLHRARQMNDPHARVVLNSAAFWLGQLGDPAHLPMLLAHDAALETVG